MEQQYGVSLLVGELFTGVNYKDNKNKIKANIVLQHEIRDNFSRITSFEVGHQKFNSVVTNYVNKLKKNKGRKGCYEIFGEWLFESNNRTFTTVCDDCCGAPPSRATIVSEHGPRREGSDRHGRHRFSAT